MAKFTRADFIRGAAQALSQQNFPAVYKNAHAALALGAPVGATYLCSYYHHEIVAGLKRGGAEGVPPGALANFGIMYQVSEHYQVPGYTDFTNSYQKFFGNSTMSSSFKTEIRGKAAEYTKYLQAKQMQYSEMTAVGIGTAEHIASIMEQSVLQQAAQNSHQAQAMEMHAPPPPAGHGYHPEHPKPEKVPLIGHKHSSNSECCCGIS
jgi:hypothetical protein